MQDFIVTAIIPSPFGCKLIVHDERPRRRVPVPAVGNEAECLQLKAAIESGADRC